MAQDRIHIVTHENGWAVKREGKSEADSVHATQKEAIEAGRDLAIKSECDLVVHRADGTFRKVYSMSGIGEGEGDEQMAEKNGSGRANRRLDASDIVSVGSRISWGAILAGAAVALAVIVTLGVLSTAIGISAWHRQASDRTLFILAMVCFIFTLVVALFVGGFVTSRITAGEDKTEALTYGIVLWGVLSVGLAALSAAGVNVGASALAVRNESRLSLPEGLYNDLGLTNVQTEKLNQRLEEARPRLDPQSTAWWTFAGIILSIAAAVAGSLAGAGPTLVLRQIRERSGPASATGVAPAAGAAPSAPVQART